jgi:murein DD-endopeptidase MepM/ murein hydrolase activator NlpD
MGSIGADKRPWIALFAVWPVWAQSVEVRPLEVRQGETLHVTAPGGNASARMNGRTIPLFPQPAGGTRGLMPVPAGEKPGSYTLEILDARGGIRRALAITVLDAHFRTQNVVLAPGIAGLKAAPGEMETVDAFRKTVSDARFWEEPLGLPVAGCMTSAFGVKRLRNGKPTGDYHGGVDQRAAAGTPIRAIAAGTVRLVRSFEIHGNMVAVDHGQGLESIYLHLSRFAAAEGAVVKKGDVLGYAGSTGRSTAPHLHWSIYVNGVPVNPGQWVELHSCAPPAKR